MDASSVWWIGEMNGDTLVLLYIDYYCSDSAVDPMDLDE